MQDLSQEEQLIIKPTIWWIILCIRHFSWRSRQGTGKSHTPVWMHYHIEYRVIITLSACIEKNTQHIEASIQQLQLNG